VRRGGRHVAHRSLGRDALAPGLVSRPSPCRTWRKTRGAAHSTSASFSRPTGAWSRSRPVGKQAAVVARFSRPGACRRLRSPRCARPCGAHLVAVEVGLLESQPPTSGTTPSRAGSATATRRTSDSTVKPPVTDRALGRQSAASLARRDPHSRAARRGSSRARSQQTPGEGRERDVARDRVARSALDGDPPTPARGQQPAGATPWRRRSRSARRSRAGRGRDVVESATGIISRWLSAAGAEPARGGCLHAAAAGPPAAPSSIRPPRRLRSAGVPRRRAAIDPSPSSILPTMARKGLRANPCSH